MTSHQARRECRRKIIAAVGPGGFEAFLKAPQPAMEDHTGEWLLKHEPRRLLDRLRQLEHEKEKGVDDD